MNLATNGTGQAGAFDRHAVNKNLMQPLDPRLIKKVNVGGGEQADYVEVGAVYHALYETTGPTGWSRTTKSCEVVSEECVPVYDQRGQALNDQRTGQPLKAWNVAAVACVRLTIGDPTNPLCWHEDYGSGLSQGVRQQGRAKADAMVKAVSNAFKRCARVLGPRLGLALEFAAEDREELAMTASQHDTDQNHAPVQSAPEAAPTPPLTAPPAVSPGPASGAAAFPVFESWAQLFEATKGRAFFGQQRDAMAPMAFKQHLAGLARDHAFKDKDWKRVAQAWELAEVAKGAPVTWEQCHYFVDAVQYMLSQDDNGQKLPTPTQNIAGGEAPVSNLGKAALVSAEQAKNPAVIGEDLAEAARLMDPARPCGLLEPLPVGVVALVGSKKSTDVIQIADLNQAGLQEFLKSVFGDNADGARARKAAWVEAGFTPDPTKPGPQRWQVEELARVLRAKIAAVQAA